MLSCLRGNELVILVKSWNELASCRELMSAASARYRLRLLSARCRPAIGAMDRSSISSDLILLPKADRHVQVRLVASMFSLAAKRHWAFDICTATDEEIPARRGLGYLETGIRVDQDPRSTPRHILYLAFPTDGRSSRSG